MYSQMRERVVSALVFTGDAVEVKEVKGYAFLMKGDKSTPVYEYGGADVVEVYETVRERDVYVSLSDEKFAELRKESKSRVLGALNRSGEDGYTVTGDWIDIVKKTVSKGVTKEGVRESDLKYWRNITKKVKTVSGWYYIMPYVFASNGKIYESEEAMKADQ